MPKLRAYVLEIGDVAILSRLLEREIEEIEEVLKWAEEIPEEWQDEDGRVGSVKYVERLKALNNQLLRRNDDN